MNKKESDYTETENKTLYMLYRKNVGFILERLNSVLPKGGFYCKKKYPSKQGVYQVHLELRTISKLIFLKRQNYILFCIN
jgi:hypothetical protein